MHNKNDTTYEDLMVFAGRMEAMVTALSIAAKNFPGYPSEAIKKIDALQQLASEVRHDVVISRADQ